MTEQHVADLGFLPVALTEPDHDPVTQDALPAACELIDGVWTQRWNVVAVSAGIAAERAAQKASQDAQEIAGYLTEVRALREKLLNRLSLIAVAAMVSQDDTTIRAIMAARSRLLAITKPPGHEVACTKAAFQELINSEYAAILAAVPEDLRKAFKEIDD